MFLMTLVCMSLVIETNGGRPSAAWKTIDYDALEKSWEDGDSIEELMTEGEYMQEELRKRDDRSLGRTR